MKSIDYYQPTRDLWIDPVGPDQFQLAMRVVDDSGIAELVHLWLAEDNPNRGIGGRPARVSPRAFFVCMVLAVKKHQTALLSTAARIAHSELDDAQRAELGITGPVPVPSDQSAGAALQREALYKCFRDTFKRVLSTTEPVPFPKNRPLLKTEWKAMRDAVPDTTQQERMDRLDRLTNGLLHASFRMIRRAERRRWKGSQALDATVIASHARGVSDQSKRTFRDPTIGWYVRDKKHIPGHDAHLVVMTPDDPDATARTHPCIFLGIAFVSAANDPGPTGVRALRAALAAGHSSGNPVSASWLAVDRGYSNLVPDTFHTIARGLGYELIFDYPITVLGKAFGFAGAILVDGQMYCPQLPIALRDATKDYRLGAIDYALWQERLAQREHYRVRRVTQGSKSGAEAMGCPAAGSKPSASCERKPASLRTSTGTFRIRVLFDDEPDRACTNKKTFNVPSSFGVKHRQRLPHGSPEWQARYGLMRSANEGANGYLKDEAKESVGSPQRRRVRGLAAQQILVAFLVFGANLRKIDAFYERARPGSDRRLEYPFEKTRQERCTVALELVTADGEDEDVDPRGSPD